MLFRIHPSIHPMLLISISSSNCADTCWLQNHTRYINWTDLLNWTRPPEEKPTKRHNRTITDRRRCELILNSLIEAFHHTKTETLIVLRKPTYHLASPVVGIRIKNKTGIIRECNVEDEEEGNNRQSGQPLEPSCPPRTLVI
jgi:hypothetical protein